MAMHFVVGTAGHIDHGKSTLVQALTGIDPDRLKEEKARGITIDLGFAHLQLDADLRVSFVDVPGHERLVRNMLAGATGFDAVLLVVAQDESVMPQTREHFNICRLLDLHAGLIVLTKSDAADPDLQEIAREDVRALTAGSFLADAPIVSVSARTGEGLDALRDALRDVARRAPRRSATGATRLPIDRAFSMKGFGAVVTGTLAGGRLQVEDEIDLLPRGRRVRVRGLQVHGERVRDAENGQRVAVNLGDIEVADLTRGDTLAEPGAFDLSSRCEAIVWLVDAARPLKHGTRVRFHQGTREVMARVALVDLVVEPGARAYARVRLEAPVVLTRGDRFVLRAYSPVTTIGGGIVLDPQPPRGALRSAAARTRFERLDPGDGADMHAPAIAARAVTVMIEEAGRRGLAMSALVARVGLGRAEGEGLAARLEQDGQALRIDDRLLSPVVFDRLIEQLVEHVTRHHETQPDSDGVPREDARARLDVSPRVFDRLIERLAADGRVAGRDRLARAGHHASITDSDAAVLASLETWLREAGLKPPETADLARRAGLQAAAVDRLLTLLVRQKKVVKMGALVFHQDALDRLKEETRALKAAALDGRAIVDVASFKARYDVSRKYAIPLLEYLDRERVTRRIGDQRLVV